MSLKFCMAMGNEEITISDNTARQVGSFMKKITGSMVKKEQQISAILPVYTDTFRGPVNDTDGKLVHHTGKLVMKVNKVDFVRLKFDRLNENGQF